MDDLTVENMFTEKWYTVDKLVPGLELGTLDRKRIIEHVVAAVTSEILSAPGSNPIGLTITVSMEKHPFMDEAAVLVRASTPQYELDDSFFAH